MSRYLLEKFEDTQEVPIWKTDNTIT